MQGRAAPESVSESESASESVSEPLQHGPGPGNRTLNPLLTVNRDCILHKKE